MLYRTVLLIFPIFTSVGSISGVVIILVGTTFICATKIHRENLALPKCEKLNYINYIKPLTIASYTVIFSGLGG